MIRAARALALLGPLLLAATAAPAPVAARGVGATVRGQAAPVPDPALVRDLDTVMRLSPAASCLTVAIDGKVAYQRNSSAPEVPASTEKLITATAALELLGPDTRFTTAVQGPGADAAGLVRGDVALVGGGDPGLTSSIYRAIRHLPDDRTITLLDDLADEVAKAGVRRITGGVVGDEARYDTLRVVPSWPDRYARQNQAGPLSALDVDDGYTLEAAGDGYRRVRADDPALAAARTFTSLLRAKGVVVDGPARTGTGASSAPALASIQSAPLRDVVGDMLRHSDNQTAELLTKELGRAKGGAGTTAAGAEVLRRWRADHDLAPAGSATLDGSGLDPGNRVTCDELVTLLGLGGGRDGIVAAGLPVAATSGTLRGRFRGSPAAGRLRAKTGSLSGVTALSGFVDAPSGSHATFAYIANGQPVSAQVLAAQDLLATILATHEPPCAAAAEPDVVALVPAALPLAVLAAGGPVVAAASPGLVAATEAAERHPEVVADRCTAKDPDAHLALVP